MKGTFRKELQIAGISSESKWNKFRVLTLLQNVAQKQPSINAYLGARYSRSADSVIDIAKEIIDNNTDAAERLEKIFHGYGHKSVGDMADLFVCMENIPMLGVMRFFYTNSVLAGQERSTRYQDFGNPQFVRIPEEVCKDRGIRKEYETLILKQMSEYRRLLPLTKKALKENFKTKSDQESTLNARTFDTVRYLIPLGLHSSFAVNMSARSWSEEISFLNASDNVVDNELGNLLLQLLGQSDIDIKGYIREADGLIRHTDANCCRRNSNKEILEYIKHRLSKQRKYITPKCEDDTISISHNVGGIEDLITHYELLINPLGSKKEYEFDEKDERYIGEKIFEYHNHHNLMGNIGQSGSIRIEGMSSVGSLKDLNRHRSMERYIPFFHDEIDIDNELDRENKDCYFLCNYLEIEKLQPLRKEYTKVLNDTYK